MTDNLLGELLNVDALPRAGLLVDPGRESILALLVEAETGALAVLVNPDGAALALLGFAALEGVDVLAGEVLALLELGTASELDVEEVTAKPEIDQGLRRRCCFGALDNVDGESGVDGSVGVDGFDGIFLNWRGKSSGGQGEGGDESGSELHLGWIV
jgi:hypothetical protein